jgi:DeoR family fructose operon transcriptional repressor
LDKDNLSDYYRCDQDGWHFRADDTIEKFDVPYLQHSKNSVGNHTPDCIGVILPFFEHEWYQNMVNSMRSYARQYGAFIEIVDVEQTEKDEIDLRQREIANRAVQEITSGDVIFLEGGSITNHMIAMLAEIDNLTVITNSLPIFNALKEFPNIILISTGGVLRRNSETLVGPTAENSLKDLRSDKLFLIVSGISLDFGLSHTNVSEVTIKQTMIQSAREVILLADNTSFGQEAFVQIAPVQVVHKIITDDALPASTRLQLSQLGIEVVIASL